MDRTDAQWGFREGDEGYGADGEKVGKVIAVEPSYVVVEKGFFFPTDYYIPLSAIANVEDGRIYLNVTKDAALNQGWDAEPAGTAEYATTGYVEDVDVAATGATTDVGYAAGTVRAGFEDTTRVAEGETLRVPVHEEELTATKHARELGQVRVEKDVVAEEKVLEVLVTE